MENDSNFVKSLYLPQDCLQGAEFPGHIIWGKNIPAKIRVFLPDGVTVDEMYNVKENGFKFDNNMLYIFEFEANGYVGFVFKSKKFEESSLRKTFKFVIEADSGEIVEKSLEIYLFRPEIVIEDVPNTITIDVDINDIKISKKIKIKNVGNGTAILSLTIPEGSNIIKKKPEDFEEFAINFWNDLNEKFASIKEDYAEYGDILDEFVEIGRNPVQFTKEYLNKLENLFKKLEEAFENDEDFMYDFAEAVLAAYISNLNIITEITSFLEFLKSSVGKKILLYEPMAILEIPKSEEQLLVNVTVTDLAENEYPPLEVCVKLNINSNEEIIRVPMYSLFEFE